MKNILEEHTQRWRSETTAHTSSLHEFLNWFNTSDSVENSVKSGWWDFSFHILKPALIKALGCPYGKKALEIGYGGGRLTLPACKYFEHVTGIDIHDQKDTVDTMMRNAGAMNFTLLRNSGTDIPMEQNSVDMVYSYIVLQHLPTLESFGMYLRNIKAVLRPSGVGILYVGCINKPGMDYIDTTKKKVDTVRKITLRLTPAMANRIAGKLFDVIGVERSLPRPWEPGHGKQLYIMIRNKK